MKKTYIYPSVEVVTTLLDPMMETISIPTTGHVDNPSFGQGKGMVIENGKMQGEDNLWDD